MISRPTEIRVLASVVVIIIAIKTFTLLAANAIAHVFLLAVPLVLTHVALILAAVATVLAFIGSTALLPAILPIVGIRERHYGRR
jgi:hypothetical protein